MAVIIIVDVTAAATAPIYAVCSQFSYKFMLKHFHPRLWLVHSFIPSLGTETFSGAVAIAIYTYFRYFLSLLPYFFSVL